MENSAVMSSGVMTYITSFIKLVQEFTSHYRRI